MNDNWDNAREEMAEALFNISPFKVGEAVRYKEGTKHGFGIIENIGFDTRLDIWYDIRVKPNFVIAVKEKYVTKVK